MGTAGPGSRGHLDDPSGPGDQPARGDLPGRAPAGPPPAPHGFRARHHIPGGPQCPGPAQE
eukprot:3299621-Alexandrium_andersonii.AAC.1